MAHSKLYRNFLILQEDEKGYSVSSDKPLSAYAKVEGKGDKCKITFYAQNLKKDNNYHMFLICSKKGVKQIIDLGAMNINEQGRAEISSEYNMNDIANTTIGVEKISGAAIVKLSGSNVTVVMYGFMSGEKIPEDWKKFNILNLQLPKETAPEAPAGTGKNLKEEAPISESMEELQRTDELTGIPEIENIIEDQVRSEPSKQEVTEAQEEPVSLPDEKAEVQETSTSPEINEEDKEKSSSPEEKEAEYQTSTFDARKENKEEQSFLHGKEAEEEETSSPVQSEEEPIDAPEEVSENKPAMRQDKNNNEAEKIIDASKEENTEPCESERIGELDENVHGSSLVDEYLSSYNLVSEKREVNEDKKINEARSFMEANEFEKYEKIIEESKIVFDDKVNPYAEKEEEKESQFILRGSVGEFFESVAEGFEPIKEAFREIKYCKWYKINVDNFDTLCNISNYNKYTIVYYPMMNYYPYIKKYGYFTLGYKCDPSGKMKYLVYGIPGKKDKSEQPYGGKSGFVTWVPDKDMKDGMGFWLMFYDFKNSVIVVPMK